MNLLVKKYAHLSERSFSAHAAGWLRAPERNERVAHQTVRRRNTYAPTRDKRSGRAVHTP
jgi:hypothetical protein